MFFFHYLLLLLSIEASALNTNPTYITPPNMLDAPITTKPGCPHQCGNLIIPYPFGIGSKCSINPIFTIVCNTSNNPPKAFTEQDLGFGDILAITETQIFIRNSRISTRCYSSDGGNSDIVPFSVSSYDMPETFTISSDSNKLVVVGCDDNVTIAGYTGIMVDGENVQYSISSCLTMCSSPNEVVPGSCTGLGCCQTSIPSGLNSIVITLEKLGKHETLTFSPCAYAFLAGNDSFRFEGVADFEGNKLVNKTFDHVPVVLDWVVGEMEKTSSTMPRCNQAKANLTTYACQWNTECVDVFGGGYRCKCFEGFEGNPYLKPGCKDFDECALGTNSPCTKLCHNTPGSYSCSCPDGYHGDGYKSGTGCTKFENNTLKNIIIGLSTALSSILLLLSLYWLYLSVKRRQVVKQKARYFNRNGGLLLNEQMSSVESLVDRMKIFTIEELEKATDNFNVNRILGQGGQGTVYKAMLGEGRIVAIKKPKRMEETQLREIHQ